MTDEPIDGARDPQEASPDDDPGRPDLLEDEDLDLARTLINYGEVEPGTNAPPDRSEEFSEEKDGADGVGRAVAPQTMPIAIDAIKAFLQACRDAGVTYGRKAGNKVPFHGARPGIDFKHVDCSGFVREAVWRPTTPHLNIIDGSVRQHDWIRSSGFERSTRADTLQRDGVIRIAFLRPQDSPSGIGHVAFVHDAFTIESHGGVGPNSRPWTGAGWQAKAHVYVLRRP